MKGTKEKEVLTQNSSKKTAFLKSIKVKILLLIVCVVAATGLLNLCITVPSVKSNVKAVIQNYMNDITSVSGENIEEEIQFEGAEATLTPEALSALLGDIQIAGMDSCYAYVVSADGTMRRRKRSASLWRMQQLSRSWERWQQASDRTQTRLSMSLRAQQSMLLII